MSKKLNLDAASIEEMWQLHGEIGRLLSIRLMSEKRELEKRLAQLRREKEMPRSDPTDKLEGPRRERRKYPRVVPKYRNPSEPSQTWAGRGKTPRWLTAALETGHAIEEFVIDHHIEQKKNIHRRQRA
jgi:DNA-binding protein H-NS